MLERAFEDFGLPVTLTMKSMADTPRILASPHARLEFEACAIPALHDPMPSFADYSGDADVQFMPIRQRL